MSTEVPFLSPREAHRRLMLYNAFVVDNRELLHDLRSLGIDYTVVYDGIRDEYTIRKEEKREET